MLTEHRTTALERVNAVGPDSKESTVSLFFHLVAGIWILGMLLFAYRAPDRYAAAMQEDRTVEWWTALLFAIAGVLRMYRAIRRRRAFDGMVGLFCLFVAGEEISWGQRLLGFIPPSQFLAHNTQQELNLHNFADVFGKPKWVLALALFGYGVLLPLVVRTHWGRGLLHRLGASPPELRLAPWFLGCIGLLIWYPVDFTGEWVESLAALLFLASAGPTQMLFWGSIVTTLAASFAFTGFSARSARDESVGVPCAHAETRALLMDIASDEARSQFGGGTMHKRIWTAAEDGYVELDRTPRYRAVLCSGRAQADAAARRRYAVDPWGTAYWIKTVRPAGGMRRVVVYSFGPNRRRDGDPEDTGSSRGDDIVADVVIAER